MTESIDDKIFDAKERLAKGKFVDLETGKSYSMQEIYFKQSYVKGEKLEMPFPSGFYKAIPKNAAEILLLDGCAITTTPHGSEREINALVLIPYESNTPNNQDIPGFTGDMEYPLQNQ